MPTPATWVERRRSLIAKVRAASGRGDECIRWLAEPLRPGAQPEEFAGPAPYPFSSLDAKLHDAIRRILTGPMYVRLGNMISAELEEGRGRQWQVNIGHDGAWFWPAWSFP